ncbi:MFS transporter [Nocardia sp. NPDC056100]|uniref:MFS transporter n=1 Tax=Nocardia sp. NPDC056100 TaxID=3345712 RepID=UPI0035DDB73E
MSTDTRPTVDTPSGNPPNPARPRRILALGVLIMMLEGWDLGALGTVGPSLLDYEPWHATDATIGMLGSVLAVGMPIGGFLAGRAADAWGHRAPVLVCLVWVSIAMMISTFAPGLAIFALGLGLTGIGIGGLTTLTVTFVADAAPARRGAFYVGAAQCGVALGGVVVAFVGRAVLPQWSFQWLFLFGALALLLIPACWYLVPNLAAGLHTREHAPLRALRSPRFRRLTVLFSTASFFVLLLVSAVAVWLPTLLVHNGHDLRSALGFTVAFNGGAIVGTLIATVIADRGWTKATILACLACASVAMLALSAAGATWLILLMSAAAGIGAFGTQNLLNAYITASYPLRLRGTALGLIMGLGRVGAIAGPAYVSAVTGTWSAPAIGFYALIVPAVIAAAFVVLIRPASQPEYSVLVSRTP